MSPTWSARVCVLQCDLPLPKHPSRSAKLFRFSDRSIHLTDRSSVLVVVRPAEVERVSVCSQRFRQNGGLRARLAKLRQGNNAQIEVVLHDGRMLVVLAFGHPAAIVDTVFR